MSNSSFNDIIINNDCFEILSLNLVYCNVCKSTLKYDPKQGIKTFTRHLQSAKHYKNLDSSKVADYAESFHEDFIYLLVKSNISLKKVETDVFKWFFRKHNFQTLHDRKSYKKIITTMYENKIKNLIDEIKDKPFYVVVDESPDCKGRKILNILIGQLKENEGSKPFIINSLKLKSTTAIVLLPS